MRWSGCSGRVSVPRRRTGRPFATEFDADAAARERSILPHRNRPGRTAKLHQGRHRVGGGYIDNLYPASSGAGQFSEKLISLQPSIAFDTTSARLHTSVAYNPNFIFYEPTSSLNEGDHSVTANLEYRFTPRLNVDVSDSFLKSSSGFGQIGAGGISGSAQSTRHFS